MRLPVEKLPFLYKDNGTFVETNDLELAIIVSKYAKKKMMGEFDETIYDMEEQKDLEDAIREEEDDDYED